jgi:UDP-glucose 4-epimerase
MTWLVTGSSGYIGQHVIKQFLEYAINVIGLDTRFLSINSPLHGRFTSYVGDISDIRLVKEILVRENITGIINLAALKSVQDSFVNPGMYKDVNHFGVAKLLSATENTNVKYFIQSSSAAVYGTSIDGIVEEAFPTNPISPYGQSKLDAELELNRAVANGSMTGTSLRYFNVIGSAGLKFKDQSRDNIVPMVLSCIEMSKSPKIFGGDYPTPDGSCIRDYIHVTDIARAHFLAANALQRGPLPNSINLGSGTGISVRKIVEEILLQKKSNLVPDVLPRRPGDPVILVASTKLAESAISFKTQKSFQEMIASSI